jgi:transcription initiation factor TFIID TATA-box-binding protein
MVEVVNVVGSGSLSREFDLSVLAADLDSVADFDPEKYPGMYIRFSDDSALITIYRTGKFIVTGANSVKQLHAVKDELIDFFEDKGVVGREDLEWFRVQNLVCTTVIGSELNLSALAIGLGLEKTEYEPEQFPGLIYRNNELDCVVLLFSTGKAVITGSSDLEEVEAAAEYLHNELSNLQLN